MPSYPEHSKLIALDGKNETVGAFIEWLGESGYEICRWDEGNYPKPCPRSTSQWIADFFEIDENRLEAEKRQMLDEESILNARMARRKE